MTHASNYLKILGIKMLSCLSFVEINIGFILACAISHGNGTALSAPTTPSVYLRHEVQAIADACHSIGSDVIVLCHGGPIAMPDDAAYVLQNTRNVHGFYGASSMERLPTEIAITEQSKAFKAVTF